MDDHKSFKSLIIAWLNGELSKTEEDRLLKWMEQSPENAGYVSRLKDIWQASLQDVSRFAQTETEWNRFKTSIKSRLLEKKRKQQAMIRRITGIAAILIFGFISGSIFDKYFSHSSPIFITATAPPGSVASLVLADSTVVYLNAGSQLIYSPESESKNREVTLDGEAWFDVAKNPKSPFVVHTPVYDLKVTGTRFNVKAFASESEIVTTLEDGEVMLVSSAGVTLSEEIRLLPGEQAVFDKTSGKIVINQVETRYFTSWKDNKLMFINMNMKELIVILERKFGVEIEAEDASILKYHYSGTLKNETVLQVMELIKHTLPVDYRIEGQVIRIIKTHKKGG